MKPSSVLSAAGAALVIAVAGCQVIGGVRTWNADPMPPVGVCNLPSTGEGLIRLVNAANVSSPSGATAADFCIRPAGSSAWGRPIFRDGGQDTLCSGGLPYLQATVPFHVPVGSIDVKAIPAGEPCTAPATSEKDGIAIASAGKNLAAPLEVTTVLRYAGGGKVSPEAIAALHEEPGQLSGGSTYLRVVNALSGGLSIDFGSPPEGAKSLPTTLALPMFAAPIPPGAAPPAQQLKIGNVDAEGYLKQLNTGFNFVAAIDGDQSGNAIALLTLPFSEVAASLFIVGDPASKDLFPVRGLYCQDRFAANKDAGPIGFSAADVSEIERCSLTALPTLSFDSWDVDLIGANAPFTASRVAPITAAIAARTSTDVMCVTEADGIETRKAIREAATQFPYSYEVDTTTATMADDPSDENGQIPPAPTAPPCAAPIPAATVSKAYSCIAQKCSATLADGGVGPMNQSTSCLSSACFADLAELYASTQMSPLDTADDVCFDCILVNLLDPTETVSTGEAICTGSAAPAFTYQGQTPLLILSKYPFNSTKSYIYPSTGLRRGMLKAQVQFEDGLAVDVFCTQLISPQLDSSLPYVGAYGHDEPPPTDGGAGENGWADEQALQAKRAVSWIQSEAKKDGVPGVILGTFYSTIGVETSDVDAGALATGTLSPIVMKTLDQAKGGAFPRAEPQGYVRACDTCPTNPYTPGHVPLEFEPMFLVGFPATQAWTSSETLWATDDTAVTLTPTTYEPALPGNVGPLSAYYAHNWQLFRPPPTAPAPLDAGVDAAVDASK